jgi:5-methylcytosine-specific restriction endonuclease McrA
MAMNMAAQPTPRQRGRKAVETRRRRLERTHRLCERCACTGRWTHLKSKRVSIATVVNHIIPLAHGGSDDDENTENLCRPCDLIVTADQFGYKAPKQQIGADGWPI